MRIAAVQHDIVWEDRDANFERLAPWVAGAVGAGAELVLLTETFSTGFSMTPGIGEPEGGPSAQFLAGQAAEHGVWVGGTCPEVAAGEELPYNSFVLAGPDGTVHRYRKLHPFTHAGEHEQFRAGDEAADRGDRGPADHPVHLLRPALRRRVLEGGVRRRTSTSCPRTGRAAAGTTGRRCSRPAPSRTRRTSSGATGSAPRATAPTTPGTAGSSPDGGAAGHGVRRRDDRAGRRGRRGGGRHPRPVPVFRRQA